MLSIFIIFLWTSFIYQPSQSLSTASPQWISTQMFRANNQKVINMMTGNISKPTHTFVFSSIMSGVPNLAYGVKNYRGNDSLINQKFQIRKQQLLPSSFTVSIQIYGYTNIYQLAITYLAIDPQFPHHLNSFQNVPINIFRGQLVNISNNVMGVATTYENEINYTLQSAANTYKTFQNPLSSNKIVLFISRLAIDSYGPPINISIEYSIINTTAYRWKVTVFQNIYLTGLHFSQIVYNEKDVKESLKYAIIYQEWTVPKTGGVKEFPLQLRENMILGLTDFMAVRAMCGLEYNWYYVTNVNGFAEAIQIMQSNPINYDCGLEIARSTLFYIRTWKCTSPHIYYNMATDMCHDQCSYKTIKNTPALVCEQCHYACMQCTKPLDSDACSTCQTGTNRQKETNSCLCKLGYFDDGYSPDCRSCSSVVEHCQKCEHTLSPAKSNTDYKSQFSSPTWATQIRQSSNFKCITCDLPFIYNADKKICQACIVDNCKKCINTKDECGVCSPPYGVNSNGKCEVCTLSNCEACGSLTECFKCSEDYLLNPSTKQCEPCSLSNCQQCVSLTQCSKCTSPFLLNPATKECESCSLSNCQDCSSLTQCSKCISPFLLNPDTKKCESCSLSNCQECASLTQCSKCTTPFLLNPTTKECESCSLSNCQDCSSLTQCSQCTTPFLLNPDTKKCESCSLNNCQDCSSLTQCSQCTTPFLLNPDTKKCESCSLNNCQDCASLTQCSKCTSSFLLNYVTKLCQPCTLDNCQECLNSTECKKCIDGAILHPLQGQCRICNITNCLMCSDDNICEECTEKSQLTDDNQCVISSQPYQQSTFVLSESQSNTVAIIIMGLGFKVIGLEMMLAMQTTQLVLEFLTLTESTFQPIQNSTSISTSSSFRMSWFIHGYNDLSVYPFNPGPESKILEHFNIMYLLILVSVAVGILLQLVGKFLQARNKIINAIGNSWSEEGNQDTEQYPKVNNDHSPNPKNKASRLRSKKIGGRKPAISSNNTKNILKTHSNETDPSVMDDDSYGDALNSQFTMQIGSYKDKIRRRFNQNNRKDIDHAKQYNQESLSEYSNSSSSHAPSILRQLQRTKSINFPASTGSSMSCLTSIGATLCRQVTFNLLIFTLPVYVYGLTVQIQDYGISSLLRLDYLMMVLSISLLLIGLIGLCGLESELFGQIQLKFAKSRKGCGSCCFSKRWIAYWMIVIAQRVMYSIMLGARWGPAMYIILIIKTIVLIFFYGSCIAGTKLFHQKIQTLRSVAVQTLHWLILFLLAMRHVLSLKSVAWYLQQVLVMSLLGLIVLITIGFYVREVLNRCRADYRPSVLMQNQSIHLYKQRQKANKTTLEDDLKSQSARKQASFNQKHKQRTNNDKSNDNDDQDEYEDMEGPDTSAHWLNKQQLISIQESNADHENENSFHYQHKKINQDNSAMSSGFYSSKSRKMINFATTTERQNKNFYGNLKSSRNLQTPGGIEGNPISNRSKTGKTKKVINFAASLNQNDINDSRFNGIDNQIDNGSDVMFSSSVPSNKNSQQATQSYKRHAHQSRRKHKFPTSKLIVDKGNQLDLSELDEADEDDEGQIQPNRAHRAYYNKGNHNGNEDPAAQNSLKEKKKNFSSKQFRNVPRRRVKESNDKQFLKTCNMLPQNNSVEKEQDYDNQHRNYQDNEAQYKQSKVISNPNGGSRTRRFMKSAKRIQHNAKIGLGNDQ